jgi:predicted permease
VTCRGEPGGPESRRVGRRPDREIDDELAFHLEARVRENLERGMDPDEARAAAVARLGDLGEVRVECVDILEAERRREERRERLLFSWLDVKLGFRMLIRYPGLTLVGGLAMAFAIAMGAGAFEVVRQLVDPRLPIPDGDRIVALRNVDTRVMEVSRPSSADFLSWRERLRGVVDVSAVRTVQRNLGVSAGDNRPALLAEISPSAFRVTRTPPLLGRTLVDDDERPGASAVAVIGHDLWQSRFDGEPDVVGRVVRVGGVETTVVGVMPEGFRFPLAHGLWVPLRLRGTGAAAMPGGLGGSLYVFGRLTDGASRESAGVELETLGALAAADSPDTHGRLEPEVVPYARDVLPLDMPHGAEPLLYAVNVLFVMLLVLVCANVALLMLARIASREGEIVVRSALGASRGRIVGQLFAEALVLGGVAALVGLGAARVALRAWLRVLTVEADGRVPFWLNADIAPSTVFYAVLLTVLGAAVAGVVPALRMTGREVGARLRTVAAGAGGSRFGGLWTAAVVGQVALTVAFPSAAFFAWRYVAGMRALDPGFPASEYLSARLELDPVDEDGSGEPAAARLHAAARDLERRLASEPGVRGVALTTRLPRTLHPTGWVEVDEGPAEMPLSSRGHRITTARVDPGYFEVVGAAVLAGALFRSPETATDAGGNSGGPVVVNRAFVERVLGGGNAVGRHLRYWGDGPRPWYEIVGVVPDLGTVSDDPLNLAAVYHPLGAATRPLNLVVHARRGPEALVPVLRAAALDVDPTLRVHDVLPLDAVGDGLWLETRFLFRLLLGMGAVALLLSLACIYATTAFAVERRRREIGIRVALGGRASRVLGAVFARPVRQVALGVLGGGVLTAALGYSIMRGALWPVGAAWVAAYAALMMGVCLLACVVPARRALAVAPSEALRADG